MTTKYTRSKPDITGFTGRVKMGIHGSLVAIFKTPLSTMEENPQFNPRPEYDYVAVTGQIDALETYHKNPEKPALPEGHFENQMSHYQAAKAALEIKSQSTPKANM